MMNAHSSMNYSALQRTINPGVSWPLDPFLPVTGADASYCSAASRKINSSSALGCRIFFSLSRFQSLNISPWRYSCWLGVAALRRGNAGSDLGALAGGTGGRQTKYTCPLWIPLFRVTHPSVSPRRSSKVSRHES